MSWASYFPATSEIELPPVLGDVPDNRRAARNVWIATAAAVAVIVLTLVLPRLLGGNSWQFALDLAGATALGVWLLLVFPQIIAHRRAARWQREFVRLCADPQRFEGELSDVKLSVRGDRVTVTGGEVTFTSTDGTRVRVPLVSGLGKIQPSFQVQLPLALAPSAASRAVVWCTADGSVIHTRVHADGSGAA